jgi:hypothetical protein
MFDDIQREIERSIENKEIMNEFREALLNKRPSDYPNAIRSSMINLAVRGPHSARDHLSLGPRNYLLIC